MIEAGDKVRVTTDLYPVYCPRGTVCEVIETDGAGNIEVKKAFSSNSWYLDQYEYEPLDKDVEEFFYNYAEESAKHGIKITYTFPDGVVVTFDGRKF